MKTRFFYSVLVAIPLLTVEVFSFFVAKFDVGLFSDEERYFQNTSQAEYETYLASPWVDAKLGWNIPKTPTTRTVKNCLGGISYIAMHKAAA
jgi:hypothetical protein